ncbi:galactokinase [Flagellimonas sp. CMM7]|uniref:galactokinase n=1 Tax=Flagellimonas sp. CMM7 TaxID=2654676 RepID=UPI0013D5FC98|nr:galactokinase [Flagellimonas sp. CMM7]UII78718.1 galactokinase [Flagellimonas sp. CMM7]
MEGVTDKKSFQTTFQDSDVVIESPGRINLIGEHLDYNGGQVLPAAINLKVRLNFKKNGTRKCNCYSKNYDNHFEIDLDKVEISEKEWHNYFLGVVHFIVQAHPNKIKGFDCIVESDLPIGSGISSSAALECGFAKGLDALFSIGLSDDELVTISRDAEHHFVGTKCGIMDQFAVVKGKKGKLIRLDCNDLSFQYIPANIEPYSIVLLNTNVSHNLATSEYNLRRQECDEALIAIQEKYPEYDVLAHVPEVKAKEFESILPFKIFDRLLYVVQENARTIAASEALETGNLEAFGQKLFESHEGLKNLYKVSCGELDFLVDFAQEYKGVIGSRMMGGGFGGCTINLVHKDRMDSFITEAALAYNLKFNIRLSSFTVAIGDGVKRIK